MKRVRNLLSSLLVGLALTMLLPLTAPVQAGTSGTGVAYHAVLRDSLGYVRANTPLTLTLRLVDNSGSVLYQERQSATTDALGQVNVVLGNGTAATGTYADIDWSKSGMNLYVYEGTSTDAAHQLAVMPVTAVPRANYAPKSGSAATASNLDGKTFDDEADPAPHNYYSSAKMASMVQAQGSQAGQTALAKEIAMRESEDLRLLDSILAERALRVGMDNWLLDSINSLASLMGSDLSGLLAKIEQEITARGQGDNALFDTIRTRFASLVAYDNSLMDSLRKERAERISNDTVLRGMIDDEREARINGDVNEAADRAAEDLRIWDSVHREYTLRAEQDAWLLDSVNALALLEKGHFTLLSDTISGLYKVVALEKKDRWEADSLLGLVVASKLDTTARLYLTGDVTGEVVLKDSAVLEALLKANGVTAGEYGRVKKTVNEIRIHCPSASAKATMMFKRNAFPTFTASSSPASVQYQEITMSGYYYGSIFGNGRYYGTTIRPPEETTLVGDVIGIEFKFTADPGADGYILLSDFNLNRGTNPNTEDYIYFNLSGGATVEMNGDRAMNLPSLTVDATGRVTSITETNILPALTGEFYSPVNPQTNVLTLTGDAGGMVTLNGQDVELNARLNKTGVSAGQYGGQRQGVTGWTWLRTGQTNWTQQGWLSLTAKKDCHVSFQAEVSSNNASLPIYMMKDGSGVAGKSVTYSGDVKPGNGQFFFFSIGRNAGEESDSTYFRISGLEVTDNGMWVENISDYIDIVKADGNCEEVSDNRSLFVIPSFIVDTAGRLTLAGNTTLDIESMIPEVPEFEMPALDYLPLNGGMVYGSVYLTDTVSADSLNALGSIVFGTPEDSTYSYVRAADSNRALEVAAPAYVGVTSDSARLDARSYTITPDLDDISDRIATTEFVKLYLEMALAEFEEKINESHDVYYGVQWDNADPSYECTRIGSMNMHLRLPIQSGMRGCLLSDSGTVVRYLDEMDWTSEVRDGSEGQVMVEIPDYYIKFESNGSVSKVKMSKHHLTGYNHVPRMYVSAYRTTIEKSTNKLCSVVNAGDDYIGYNGTGSQYAGCPRYMSMTNARTYARNRHGSDDYHWNQYTYDVHRTLCWFFVVEYATLNSQKPFVAELDANGYRQGGLGEGVTNTDYATAYQIPCGSTDALGNRTGVVTVNGVSVNRYRGVEIPFGFAYLWTDGMIYKGGTAYYCGNPAKFSSTSVDDYKPIGTLPTGGSSTAYGCVHTVMFGPEGHIIPGSLVTDDTYSTYFTDYGYVTNSATLYGVFVGGSYDRGSYAGLFFSRYNYPSSSFSLYGSRLCYIP